jgi:bacteriophage exclusion system BrxC/D-like protein
MAVAAAEWLALIDREYLPGFVAAGGAAVKFVVGDAAEIADLGARLCRLAARHRLTHVPIDAAATRLHMIQDVFFAIARNLDWDAMAQDFVEALFDRQGYEWPRRGEAVPVHEVAAHNRVEPTLMRRDLRQWLTAEIMRDPEMTQDFRIAMTRLCLRRLEPEETQPGVVTPVVEWLRGELPRIGALKDASITAKITRHNGRAMLRSLCRWLRLCRRRGLCVALDLRQFGRTGVAAGDGLRYSLAAVMDGFEVLRQLIDDAEHFAGMLLVALADEALIDDGSRRSVGAYQALKMRIWDDVRPEGRDNPLAPLIRLGGASWSATP